MPFLLPAVLKELFGFHQKTFDVTSKKQAAKNKKKTIGYLASYVVLLLLNLLSLALILYRSYIEAAYHYVLLIAYLLINCHYLFTACKVIVRSAANVEGALFDIREAVQYKDRAEEAYVNIKTTAMGEDRIKTNTYDENWTSGLIRIPQSTSAYLEIPVHYKKAGVWEIDTELVCFDDYQEYIYYLFNR